jgi:sporadic carbohydrate cluster 2OG-Fe(II) oxygenase
MTNSELYETFLTKGYIKFPVENTKALETFKNVFQKEIQIRLAGLHEEVELEELNGKRIKIFRELNSVQNWEELYYSLGKSVINEILGNELSIQTKLNLSIQCPLDQHSILELHTDTLSGQSPYECVLWVPLTDAFGTNSMYIFSKEDSKMIMDSLPSFEQNGMNDLFEKWRHKATFIDIKEGECLLFSSTLFHGNTLNQTESTRVSMNCRFKSLFSPEFKGFKTERGTGSFYKPFKMSAATKIALDYCDNNLVFK